jgi:hypothetical protein
MHTEENREDEHRPSLRAAGSVGAQAVQPLAAEAFSAIGYEAADPGLHAPLWTEAIRATGRGTDLR